MDITKLTGFTPGPYSFGKEVDGEIPIFLDDTGDGTPDAAVFCSDAKDDDSRSVAALFAAAPDLLALAKLGLELAERIDHLLSHSEIAYQIGQCGEQAQVHGLKIKARALLNAAKGD